LELSLVVRGETGMFGSNDSDISNGKLDPKPCSSWPKGAGLNAGRYAFRFVFVLAFRLVFALLKPAGNSTDETGRSKKESQSMKVSSEWSGDVV